MKVKLILPVILVLVSFSHLPARDMENTIENFPAGTWREERVAAAKGGISYTVDTAGRIIQVFIPPCGQVAGGEIHGSGIETGNTIGVDGCRRTG